jgi:hypothetical protein
MSITVARPIMAIGIRPMTPAAQNRHTPGTAKISL